MAVLPMLLMTPATVFAQSNQTPASNSVPATSAQSEPTTSSTGETTEQRIVKYKKIYALQVTPVDQAKLKSKCKASQAKGKLLSASVVEKNKVRSVVYKDILNTLDKIINKLDDADYDTTNLKAQRKELQKLVTNYTADVKTYTDTLTDMTTIDCATDPVGFKASLEAARISRARVSKDIVAIRIYVETTIKKSLKEASTSLKDSSATNSQTTTEITKPNSANGGGAQ